MKKAQAAAEVRLLHPHHSEEMEKIGQKDGHLVLLEQGATQLLKLSYFIKNVNEIKIKMRVQLDLVQPESTNQGMLGFPNQSNHF